MKRISRLFALLLGGAMLITGCDEKNAGNGGNDGGNGTDGEPAVLFLDGVASENVTVGSEAVTKTLKVTLSAVSDKDCSFALEVDESLLGGKTLLPENLYRIEGTGKVVSGAANAEMTVTVKTQIVDEDVEYALPLRLLKSGKGDFEVDDSKSAYTLGVKYEKYVAPEVPDGLAMFSGRSGLVNNEFNETLENFTFELRFQIENFGNNYVTDNTVGRNRDVFYFGDHVIARFEDPNNNNTPGLVQHSQVQFQGGGAQPNCFNPAYTADYAFEIGKWQHLAVTHDKADGQITMYMNGEKVEMQDNPAWFVDKFSAANLDNYEFPKLAVMGGAFALDGDVEHQLKNGFDYWGACKVVCSEVRIWSVARTAREITENMEKSVDAKSEGLVGYWNMNRHSAVESDGKTVFRDLTGNGHELATSQSVTWLDGASAFGESVAW